MLQLAEEFRRKHPYQKFTDTGLDSEKRVNSRRYWGATLSCVIRKGPIVLPFPCSGNGWKRTPELGEDTDPSPR
jgi:hypothetical protein